MMLPNSKPDQNHENANVEQPGDTVPSSAIPPNPQKHESIVHFLKRKLSHASQKQSASGRQHVVVDRPVYSLPHFEHEYGFESAKETTIRQKLKDKARKSCSCSPKKLLDIFYTFFPIFQWLPAYKWKLNFVPDLLAGITVGVMSVPQGMAFARLANLSPIHGLYANFVTTLVYAVMGTSRHASIGTEAVASLLMGTMIDKHVTPFSSSFSNGTLSKNTTFNGVAPYTALELATSTALLEGFILLAMGSLRLGFVSVYLSDQLVGGFTTGIALHVLSSQVPALFGITISSHDGPGKLIELYVEFFGKISQVNYATLCGSVICITFLLVVKFFIDPHAKRKLRVPLPSELIVVIVGTVVSHFANLQEVFKCKVVGIIPAGFPTPTVPRFDLMHLVVLDTFILAIVCYSLSVSLCKLYAKKHNYKINPYQEFFAYGGMNVVGSMFQCYPSGNSTSRILIFEGAGAKSQLAAIVGTFIVIITILFIAPYLESLPNFCLASMIVVACFFMLRSMKDLFHLWKTCKIDFSIYLVTFLAVVFLDVTYGLALSVLYAFFTVIIRTQCPAVHELGTVGQSGLYGEVNEYNRAKLVPGIKVVHFTAPLYYANTEHFRPKLYKRCNINLEEMMAKRKEQQTTGYNELLHHVVLDCSGFSYVDLMGVNVLKQVFTELQEIGIELFLSNCNTNVRRMFEKTNFYDSVPRQNVFITLHDAVLAAVKMDRIHSSYSLVEMENLVNAISADYKNDTVKL